MDLNLLQRDVAVTLGVNEATIHNWETGNHSVSLSAWPAVLGFLGYDPRPPGRTIGERLRLHREALGLSAAAVARQWGVDPATVTKHELKEDRFHNHLSLPRIAGFLGYNPLPPPQTPGQYVRQVRYLSGLKQTEFAARLRVSNNSVSEWELQQNMPTPEELDRMEAISRRLPVPFRPLCAETIKKTCADAVQPDRRFRPRSTAPVELNTLGDHIRKRRFDLGLSQVALARKFGVNRNAVTNWETGVQKPGLGQMPGVIEFLGYEPSNEFERLADAIRVRRRSLGLTQEAFSELVGVSRETVNLWERGKREPTGAPLRLLNSILTSTR
jgi:DNA-binding transcriptional regulator YiaG